MLEYKASSEETGAGSHELTSRLLSLSPELILEIASHIVSPQEIRLKSRDPLVLDRCHEDYPAYKSKYNYAQKSLSNLRLSSRYLGHVLRHVAFEVLVFDFNVKRFSVDNIKSRLTLLADPSHPSHVHGKILRIHRLSPVLRRERSPWNYVYANSLHLEESDRTEDLHGCMTSLLLTAISSLRNLRCISWNVDDNTKQNALVLKALSSLPSLEDVTLHLDHYCEFPPEVTRLSGLRSLAIQLVSVQRPKMIEAGVARIISQSPLLSHFHLIAARNDSPFDYGQGDTSFQGISFQGILTKIPDSRMLAHLTSLRLQTATLAQANQNTVNYLKSLRSLHLEELFTSGNTIDDSCSMDGFWGKMRAAEVELYELTVNSLSDALLDYLTSFSTLRLLHIELIAANNPQYNGRLFYATILPLHGLSLVVRSRVRTNFKNTPSIHGMLYERRLSQNNVSHHSSAIVMVCADAIPYCLSFVMSGIMHPGLESLDRLEICYSPSRQYPGRGGEIGFDVHVAADQWLSRLPVERKGLHMFPKQVRISYRTYELFPNKKTQVFKYRAVDKM